MTHEHHLTISSKEEALAFLFHMAHHNEDHAEELAEFINYLNQNNETEAAELLEEALVKFVESNNKLRKALEVLK